MGGPAAHAAGYSRNTRRGSAVITVLVLAAVTAVIASGFVFRSAQEAKLATRSYYQSVALNLAEAGIEEGLFAANTSTFNSTNGWTLVSGSTTDYNKALTSGFNFQQATGAIYVRVDAAISLTPTVTSMAVLSFPNQRSVIKQLKITATKRRLWGNGIVAKNTLTFSGNAAIDSYDSSHGVYNATTNRGDQATVATTSTALDPVVLGSSASIYGYVATGGDDPVVGTGGRIYGATTPSGTNVDTTRIRHDFTANLPDATAPTTTTNTISNINSSTSLPHAGDTMGANGRYLYTTAEINLNGNDTIAITGPVDLIVTGNVTISGTSQMTVGGASYPTASLNLYTPGTVVMTGNGLNNGTNDPAKVGIWGTATSTGNQTINIGGNGNFTGTVYAPNAVVTLSGNGANSGAIIAKSATVSGSGVFHYDVHLATLQASLDVSYRLASWCELTAAPGSSSAFARDSRTPFASLF